MYLYFPLILFYLVLTWAVEFLKRSRRERDEELNDLYSSPNILRGHQIKNNEIHRPFSTNGEGRGAYRILVRKPF
jgi:hypothetical protein